ncbi:hypothetical protein [Achromobacter insolitus]|uniref:hypothetical protein n=1 Tax=Achromobacter insolitus TaxID=217204 RepID=UPI0007C23270|nr:hypothetical protein [Achromobacter insolitus]OAD16477.1 hypothetical protein A3839_28420 [Achromobacter insolitus]
MVDYSLMSYPVFLLVVLGIPCAAFFYLLRVGVGFNLAGWYAALLCVVLFCTIVVIESYSGAFAGKM